MKNILKWSTCMAFVMLVVTSCSKETGDSLGRDAINNIIRSGKWTQQTRTVTIGDAAGVTTEMLGEEDYLEFKKDNRAWTYRAGGSATSVPYRLVDKKTMEYDGVQYTIQENIIANISTMTLINQTDATETKIEFKR